MPTASEGAPPVRRKQRRFTHLTARFLHLLDGNRVTPEEILATASTASAPTTPAEAV